MANNLQIHNGKWNTNWVFIDVKKKDLSFKNIPSLYGILKGILYLTGDLALWLNNIHEKGNATLKLSKVKLISIT